MADPVDVSAMLNANLGGWNNAMGLRFSHATTESCTAELEVGPQHLQPYGIVHGGVHAGIIEAACSTGAAIVAMGRGQSVVGLENATSFIAAARGGTLRVTATPVTRGRRTQVWQATVTDAAGKTLATGRVRLLCLEAGSDLAGKTV
ncbi:MAG: PaaI family thioesterase [Deltaproteobacteria bacterium]|nr:PaaI family thioesterase [Deltaproteobacteria bacterium]